MKRILPLFIVFAVFLSCSQDKFPRLEGPYMGQPLPGETAELFAPGIISNDLCNRDVAMNPDGKEMIFAVHTADFSFASLIVSQEVKGVWTKPEVMSFATDPRYTYIEPTMSHDGQHLYFCSTLPKDGTDEPGDQDIWVVDRTEEGWSEPRSAGANINSENLEFFPSITRDGTLYFTRADLGTTIHYIYRSKWVDGEFAEAERLPEQVNLGANRFNACVAPDESYMIVPATGGPDAIGGVDYYITFRNEDDTWSEPVNMGPEFNHARGQEWSPYVTPDGKYIFFMATVLAEHHPDKLTYDTFINIERQAQNGNPDIYWIGADVIDSLRKQKIEK